MVQDAVGGLVQAQGVVAGAGGVAAGPDSDVTADDVGARRERDFAGVKANAAGGGLAGDRDIRLHGNSRRQRNMPAYVEDDDASAVAYRVAKRTRAAVVQIADVNDRSVASAGGIRAKAKSAGESGGLGM